jgi:chromosome segregation ATPase
MVDELQGKLKEVTSGYSKLQLEISKANYKYIEAVDIQNETNGLHAEVASNQRMIVSKETDKLKKLESLNEALDSVKLTKYTEDLTKLLKSRLDKQGERSELFEDNTYYAMCEELLRDTGIKTKIIRQYLPAMNKLINEYLQIFDFFVSFTIDENFNEKIRSRHRDDFSYASFSEGEKARIDLALMFTWRRVAKLKNSIDSNLLILDEIMDASLDEAGLDALKTVFDSLEKDSNIFVISHRGEVKESSNFSRIIKVYKKDLFTKIAVEV